VPVEAASNARSNWELSPAADSLEDPLPHVDGSSVASLGNWYDAAEDLAIATGNRVLDSAPGNREPNVESSTTMDIDESGVRIQQNIVNQNCVIQSQGHIDINSAVYISNNIVASTAAAMHEHALAAQQQQQSVSQQQQLAAAVETIRVEAERRHAEAMRQLQHESSMQSF